MKGFQHNGRDVEDDMDGEVGADKKTGGQEDKKTGGQEEVRYWVEFAECPHWRLGVAVKPGELGAKSAEEWMGFLWKVAMVLEERTHAQTACSAV